MRDQDVCTSCHTQDCIRGRREPVSDLVVIRGCELALFQPRKGRQHGLHLLPGLRSCLPARQCRHPEPAARNRVADRSHPLRDRLFFPPQGLAALAIVFTFGALLNAFGMVSPVYAVEGWLGRMLHVSHEAPVLGMIFAFFLILEPVLLLGLAAWLTLALGRHPARVASADGAIHVRSGAHGLRNVAGPLRISFFDRTLHHHSRDPERAWRAWEWPLLGEPRWTLTGLAASHRAGDRDRVSSSRVGGVVDGELWPGGRRLAAQADAGIYPMGYGQPDSLDRIDVADVPAHGNARHHDDRIDEG